MATASPSPAGRWRKTLRNTGMYLAGQDIVRPLSDPLKKDSHLVILYGNVAPEGAVAKITGKEGLAFSGPARVFEGEERATEAILGGTVRRGRRRGHPERGAEGRSGHARDAQSDRRHHGPRAGRQGGAHHRWAFLRRQSRLCRRTYFAGGGGGRSHRAAAQWRSAHHRCRASAQSMSSLQRRELRRRRARWKPRKPYATGGVLAKYAVPRGQRLEGAVTEPAAAQHSRILELRRSCQCTGQRLEFSRHLSMRAACASEFCHCTSQTANQSGGFDN